ncbi:MAG: DUF952 domain-containing protein [Hyphomicrobiaceae bacterium]
MVGMVYKICSSADWRGAKLNGFFHGSPDDLRDGFIHLSTSAQLSGTLQKHFSDSAGKALPGLVLVGFEADALGPKLKWEPARDGALFPHLYAPIETQLAVSEVALEVDATGRHCLPGELGGC